MSTQEKMKIASDSRAVPMKHFDIYESFIKNVKIEQIDKATDFPIVDILFKMWIDEKIKKQFKRLIDLNIFYQIKYVFEKLENSSKINDMTMYINDYYYDELDDVSNDWMYLQSKYNSETDCYWPLTLRSRDGLMRELQIKINRLQNEILKIKE